jgi:hypothetical protein
MHCMGLVLQSRVLACSPRPVVFCAKLPTTPQPAHLSTLTLGLKVHRAIRCYTAPQARIQLQQLHTVTCCWRIHCTAATQLVAVQLLKAGFYINL